MKQSLTLLTTVLASLLLSNQASAKQLKVNENGKFKVMQITDIHYGEDEQKDSNTTLLMEKLIQWEKPDLVILTGDMVSGYAWDQTEGWYEKQWKKWTQAFINQNQTYMYIQGNHDSQADLDRDEVTEVDIKLDISLTEQGPAKINGSTNYVKSVYSRDGSKQLFHLWAFDSMSDDCEGVSGWGCVYPSQIAWYRDKSKNLTEANGGKVLPGYAFFHIPLPEFQDMWNLNTIHGQKNEGISCQSVDTGLFAAFKEIGDMKGVFCGHDHDNDFWGDYNGIKLHYGRKTGYGGYGPSPFFWMQRGARVIEYSVDKDDKVSMESWIREENGFKKTKQYEYPHWLKFSQNECAGMKPHEDKFVANLYKSRESVSSGQSQLSQMVDMAEKEIASMVE